jgi:hypothetical protein
MTNRYEVVRTSGTYETEHVVDSANTAELARQRANEARQDANTARMGHSDTYGVRERSS